MEKKLFALLLGSLLGLAGCQKPVEYPIEPQITYQGFCYLVDADSTLSGEGILSLGYTDGDGDLGLDDDDKAYPFGSGDPFYYNLIVEYMKWNGSTFEVTPMLSWNQQTQSFDTISFNARFKRLIDGDEPKAISGTIDYTMSLRNPYAPHDTLKLRVHLIDRALHESNCIETEIITF